MFKISICRQPPASSLTPRPVRRAARQDAVRADEGCPDGSMSASARNCAARSCRKCRLPVYPLSTGARQGAPYLLIRDIDTFQRSRFVLKPFGACEERSIGKVAARCGNVGGPPVQAGPLTKIAGF